MIKNNQYGYYHPSEIAPLFDNETPLFESITNEEWLGYYLATCNDVIQIDEYLELERDTILKELYKDTDTNKDFINMLGYNENLPYNINSIKKQSKRLYNILNEDVELIDGDSIDILNESIINDKKTDSFIYVVLTNSGSAISKIIKSATNDNYTHSGISFDLSMDKIFTFNRKGFTFDTMDIYKKYGNIDFAVFAIPISKYDINKIDAKLNEMLSNRKKWGYSIIGLFGVLFNNPIIENKAKFCSQFVDELLKLVDKDVTGKDSGLARPQDFKNKYVLRVFEGKLNDYSESKAKKIVNKLLKSKNNIISEKAPIEFNNKGDLIIKIESYNYEEQYQKSHRLLMIYDKNDNVDGMRYEVARLWYLSSKLESLIYNKKTSIDDKKKYTNIRARVINDFTKYMNILNRDKSFNFERYYNTTEFSKDIKISKHTLEGIIRTIKMII